MAKIAMSIWGKWLHEHGYPHWLDKPIAVGIVFLVAWAASVCMYVVLRNG